MTNNIRGLGLLLVLPLLTVSAVTAFDIPTASALSKRDDTSPNDQHCTARITCSGQHRVCGDHICSSAEYSKFRDHISKAQNGITTSSNDKSMSDKSMSDKSMSDKSMSDKSMSDKSMSDKSMSDKHKKLGSDYDKMG